MNGWRPGIVLHPYRDPRKLHSTHQGVERTKHRARQLVYWPGLPSDITNMERVKYARRRCPVFNESISFTIPVHHVCSRTLPSTFFCHASNQCMIYYDRLSGWPAVFEFVKRDLCYHDVIRSCMRCFFDFGMPVRIRSDGGTNLTSAQTLAFFDNWGVTAVNLTPPPSLHLQQGLLEWCNTPSEADRRPQSSWPSHRIHPASPSHHLFQQVARTHGPTSTRRRCHLADPSSPSWCRSGRARSATAGNPSRQCIANSVIFVQEEGFYMLFFGVEKAKNDCGL